MPPGACSNCKKDFPYIKKWHKHLSTFDASGKKSDYTFSKTGLCSLMSARFLEIPDTSDDEDDDGAGAMAGISDAEDDGPVVLTVGPPEDAFTKNDIVRLVELEYGTTDYPYRYATLPATDVGGNNGLLSPLTDVEKAVAHVVKYLPDTERDVLLSTLHKGCATVRCNRSHPLQLY